MDPSIMKLLEEDEDETMHSGADVEAFTAALNRDIEGDTSTSQRSDSDSAPLSQGSNQLFPQWQSSSQDENTNGQNQQNRNRAPQQEQHSSEIELKQHGSVPENRNQQIDTSHELNHIPLQPIRPQDDCQQRQGEQSGLLFSQTMGIQNSERNSVHIREQDRTHNPEIESQFPRLQKMANQQSMAAEQAMNPMNRGKQVPFAMLLPVLQPQLDKEKGMQLNTIYTKLKKNEISKDGFVRHMRAIVGDQMLKMAVYKLQVQAARNSQTGPNQLSLQSQASAQPQHMKMPSVGANQGNAPQSFAQLHQRGITSLADMSHIPSSAAQLKTYSSSEITDDIGPKSREMEWQSDSSQMSSSSLSNINQERERPTIPIQGLSKQQQQHLHFSQASFPVDGSTGGSYRPFSGANVSSSASSLKHQPPDSQLRQGPVHQNIGATQFGTSTQSNSRISSATSLVGPGSNAKTPPKKPSSGQKKPLEPLGSSPPLSSKKQKVSGAFLDQSIEQLNDVTAVSGVNLREEEEQLFSGPKEDSQVSEASRRVVQEEEDRQILQKIPLQKKLAEIISKCGLKSTSNDVERCLSLCVEERMRGLISNLIRLSKQRVDIEKRRHQTVFTSDVQQQIMAMNQKAREEWDKKKTEAEILQKLDDSESNGGVDGDKEKDEGRVKALKANKEEDDKMRTTAANVAARAAVGGDDMLSKWQLMAEQARQKREGVTDVSSASQPANDVSRKLLSTSEKNERDNQEAEKRGQPTATVTSGPSRKFSRNQVMSQPKVARSISIKDVIAVLEREPQMSKTTLMYRLYEKTRVDSVAE
ncbi:hypothetical protein U1Q18_005542 [Sarracenia purpurea var. burkii]